MKQTLNGYTCEGLDRLVTIHVSRGKNTRPVITYMIMSRFDTEAEIWPISSLVLLGLRWSLFCCKPVVLFLDNGKVLRCKYTILKTEIYEKTE